MPRKDKYHDQVKRALEKDGWTISHDPLHFLQKFSYSFLIIKLKL